MLSTDYLLTHYVVYICNSEDPNMCITTDANGAIDILTEAFNLTTEIDIEYEDDIEDF